MPVLGHAAEDRAGGARVAPAGGPPTPSGRPAGAPGLLGGRLTPWQGFDMKVDVQDCANGCMPMHACRHIDLQVDRQYRLAWQIAIWMRAEKRSTCVGSADLSTVGAVSTLSAVRLVSSESSTCMHAPWQAIVQRSTALQACSAHTMMRSGHISVRGSCTDSHGSELS